MKDVLDIGAVAAATGLTLRALRFYEARGLVRPLRTAGGLAATVHSPPARGSLIRTGDKTMEQENWEKVSDAYLSDEAKADFAAAAPKMPADFDQAAYAAKWDDLAKRIEAALPLDPKSARARAFHDEWTALLAPFTAVATPAMMQDVGKMYDRMGEWQGQQQPPFSPAVWAFIKSVGPAPAG